MTEIKRAYPRIDLKIEVQVEQESRLQQFYSRNLSQGGIFLEVADTPPAIGSKLKLAFEVPTLKKNVEVTAEVLHHHTFEEMDDSMHRHTKTGIGLKFLDLAAEDEKLLAQFVRGKDLHVRS